MSAFLTIVTSEIPKRLTKMMLGYKSELVGGRYEHSYS